MSTGEVTHHALWAPVLTVPKQNSTDPDGPGFVCVRPLPNRAGPCAVTSRSDKPAVHASPKLRARPALPITTPDDLNRHLTGYDKGAANAWACMAQLVRAGISAENLRSVILAMHDQARQQEDR